MAGELPFVAVAEADSEPKDDDPGGPEDRDEQPAMLGSFRFVEPESAAVLRSMGEQMSAQYRWLQGLQQPLSGVAAVLEDFEPLRLRIQSWSSAFDWSGLARFRGVMQAAVSVVRPWNLHEVDLADMEAVAAMAMEDGIPVAWVPRGLLVEKLVATPPGNARFTLLVDHADEVLNDCEQILDRRGGKTQFAHQCREAIAVYRAGHRAAAQSHAANVVDSLVIDAFGRPGRATAKTLAAVPLPDTTLGQMSLNLALRPLVHAFVSWHVDQGASPPGKFSRHATAHAAGTQGVFSPAASLVSVMLATSLTIEFVPGGGADR